MTAPAVGGTAAAMAWAACGSPTHDKITDQPGMCLVCGAEQARTGRPKDTLGANFDLLSASRRDADRVCEPCAWTLAGKPPDTLRMWAVVVTDGASLPPDPDPAKTPARTTGHDHRIHLTNRGAPAALIQVLTEPPAGRWAIAVPTSGQKHLVPYTPVNEPGARAVAVRFETAVVAAPPATYRALIGAVAALRVAGHSTTAIHAGHPHVGGLTPEKLAAWSTWAPVIGPHANSPLLGLAIHLTTKENIHALAAD